MSKNYYRHGMKEGWIFDNLYVVVHKELNNNSFIYIQDKKAIIIDPSFNSNAIINFLTKHKAKPLAILITHGHYDHTGESHAIKDKFKDCHVYLQNEDLKIKKNSSTIDYEFFDDTYRFAEEGITGFNKKLPVIDPKIKVSVFSSPGHTPGSVCYVIDNYVFTGDLIFADTIGRSDFRYSDSVLMQDSLKRFVTEFKDQGFWLFPGHDKWCEVDKLKQLNSFVKKYFIK